MFELLLLAAIAYAGARGVEKVLNTEDRRYDTEAARNTVTKVAASGPKDGRPARKPPGPTEPGGTFSAAAPRSAAIGSKAAYPLAVLTETSATMWKAIGEGYRQSWPEIRQEHRRKMTAKAEERRRKREQAQAARKAEQARAQAGPPPPYPPKPAEPPKTSRIDTTGGTDGTDAPKEPAAAPIQPDPESKPSAASPEPATGRRYLSVVPDPAQNPDDPAQIGDLMSSPHTLIPEIRTLDGLMNALAAIRAMCVMRAEEAQAIAADDLALSNRLDTIEAELADLEVDSGTLAEIATLRESIHTQSQTAAAYGAAAQDAGDYAAAVADAAHKSHGGIAEAVHSAPVDTPAKAEHYNR